METIGFTTREMRDEQKRRLKAEGKKHVTTYTTHDGNKPAIVWVVCWDDPKKTIVEEKTDDPGPVDGPETPSV